MSQENVDAIRSMYESFAKGDIPAVLEGMDPRIEWNEAEGFPYADGNPYVGPAAVLEGVFARLGAEWDSWSLTIDEVIDAGDRVVVTGRYDGTYKATGVAVNAQFAHLWSLRDAKAVKFQQYTDTAQVARAVAGT